MSPTQAITAFLDQFADPVTMTEAVKWLQARVARKDHDQLYHLFSGMLDESRDLVVRYSEEYFFRPGESKMNDDDPDDHLLIARRHTYLQDAQFRIKPTPYEREHGLLFPGHRFIPFCPADMMFADAELRLPGGEALPKKRHTIKVQDALIYHTLIGMPDCYAYMMTDADAGEQEISPEGIFEGTAELQLTVFDMGAVYKELPKDASLLCRVVDYDQGIYEIEESAEGGDILDFGETQSWCESFEEALLDVIEEMETFVDIPEQLARAIFGSIIPLTENPPLHIGGLLQWSETITIKRYLNRTLLWTTYSEPEDQLELQIPAMMGGTGTCDSLQEILQDIGSSYGAIEVEAYMRHALFRGKDLKWVLDTMQLLTRYESLSEYPEQLQALQDFLQQMWDDLAASHNAFAEQQRGVIRARFLKLNEAVMSVLRDCDDAGIGISELPQEAMHMLAEMAGYLVQTLDVLNEDSAMSNQEYKESKAAVASLEEVVPQMITSVRQQIGI